ncbi:MAG: ATP-binding protein [Archaeoglobaceae archaeon]
MDSFIHQDVRFVLMEMLEEPRYYFSILEAIATGNVTMGNITNYTGLERSLVGKYLNVLIDLNLIKRDIPVTASPKTKKGIYSFQDNIFSFWFGFIYPYEDLINLGREKDVLAKIDRDFNAYVGKSFEGIAKEFMWDSNYHRIGKWWDRGEEIDVVALNDVSKEIAFLECKWRDIKTKDALKVIANLERKAKLVKWHNDKRRESYGIIAKRIRNKEELKEMGYLAFDLHDFEGVPEYNQ